MPRKYPEFQTNAFGQEVRVGDTVVFITSTSRRYTGASAPRSFLMGEVVKINMASVRIKYTVMVQPWPRKEEVRPGYWETVTPEPHPKEFEANAKPEYVYVV